MRVITLENLYLKRLDLPQCSLRDSVLQPLDEILEIPEAEALWGTKKKDE